MKISEIRADYYEASGKVSDLVRNLDFAGIGVVWIFTVGKDSGGIHFSYFLLFPLLLFVASLGCDLLQYVYKTTLLNLLNRHFWKKYHDNDKEVDFSDRWNWPTEVFFWLKTAFVVAAYGLLVMFILWQVIQGQIGDS
jgi:hypothetical protein